MEQAEIELGHGSVSGWVEVTGNCVRPSVWPGFEFWYAHCFYTVV